MSTSNYRNDINSETSEIENQKIKENKNLLHSFTHNDTHLDIPNAERNLHLNGATKSYTWAEAKNIIQNK